MARYVIDAPTLAHLIDDGLAAHERVTVIELRLDSALAARAADDVNVAPLDVPS